MWKRNLILFFAACSISLPQFGWGYTVTISGGKGQTYHVTSYNLHACMTTPRRLGASLSVSAEGSHRVTIHYGNPHNVVSGHEYTGYYVIAQPSGKVTPPTLHGNALKSEYKFPEDFVNYQNPCLAKHGLLRESGK